jgi:hypothetical protein
VCRRRDSHSGSCTELDNLADDAKGKGTSGGNPSVPMKVIHFTPRNLHSRAPKDYLDHAHAPEAD